MKNFIYHNQIVHHKLCFNLFILHNNLFGNQRTEKSKNDIFVRFDVLSFTKTFFLLYSVLSLNLHRRSYRNGCEIFAQHLPKWLRNICTTKKCVFNNFWKKIAHYYNNGFEEDIYIYILIYIHILYILFIYIYYILFIYIYNIYLKYLGKREILGSLNNRLLYDDLFRKLFIMFGKKMSIMELVFI